MTAPKLSTIIWRPIVEAKRDGTEYLLWYPGDRAIGSSGPGLEEGGAIQGWWFSSPKKLDDGWETVIGFIGEPTLFAEITFPIEED